MSKLKQLIALQASNLSVRGPPGRWGSRSGAVSKYLRAVRAAGFGSTEAETLPESGLEQRSMRHRHEPVLDQALISEPR